MKSSEVFLSPEVPRGSPDFKMYTLFRKPLFCPWFEFSIYENKYSFPRRVPRSKVGFMKAVCIFRIPKRFASDNSIFGRSFHQSVLKNWFYWFIESPLFLSLQGTSGKMGSPGNRFMLTSSELSIGSGEYTETKIESLGWGSCEFSVVISRNFESPADSLGNGGDMWIFSVDFVKFRASGRQSGKWRCHVNF